MSNYEEFWYSPLEAATYSKIQKEWVEDGVAFKDSEYDQLEVLQALLSNGKVERTGFMSVRLYNHRVVSLNFLYVDARFKKMGVGTATINTLKAQCNKIYVKAEESSIPFYIKCGFKHDGGKYYVWEKQ